MKVNELKEQHGHRARKARWKLFINLSPGMYFPRFYVLRSWTNLSSEFLKHKVNFALLCKEKEGDVSFERRSDGYKWILTGDLWHFLSHMREFHRLLQVSELWLYRKKHLDHPPPPLQLETSHMEVGWLDLRFGDAAKRREMSWERGCTGVCCAYARGGEENGGGNIRSRFS